VIKYIKQEEIYFYDERLHCHDVTKLDDVARRQYISGALAAVLFIGLSLLATVCFQQQCQKFKGDRKIYRNYANFE
jgi:hypothetical protein